MKFLKALFGGLWRSLKALQSLAGTLLFLFLLFIFGSAIFGHDAPRVPDGGALVIDPAGIIVEQLTARDPIAAVLGQDRRPPETLLRDIAGAIRTARDDERITALVLSLDGLLSAGISQLHYLGTVIDEFKESGKPVYAYGNGYSQGQYLLAAHADEVYMHPFGGVFLTGYGIYPTYFKSGIEKLKANFHVFRIGEYKTFGEPYLRDDMSPAARESYSAVLKVLWDAYIEEVARERELDAAVFRASFENIAEDLRIANGDFALLAEQGGLVDGLKSWKEWQEHMAGVVGSNGNGNGVSYKQISLASYVSATGSSDEKRDGSIAVVVARGSILDGEQDAGAAGGDTIARLIRKARAAKNVKGIVLRIDSGGGSVFASEVIRREVEATQAEGMPIVASMGAVAASGGYWIASTADEIWAAPTTITGSIGIIAIFPTFDETLDSIGIHSDGVGTTPLSGALDPTRPMPELLKNLVQQSIESGYDKFITRVANGRGMTKEEVDAVGQGRVWAGATAKDLGLVDNLGSLDDAVAAAAKLADISDYRTVYIQDEPTLEQRLVDFLFAPLASQEVNLANIRSPLRRMIRDLETEITDFLALNDPQNVYALCLECRAQ